MKKYIVERAIEGVGSLPESDYAQIAARSNSVLSELAPRAQWLHSYIAADKTFCVYLAEDEGIIHQHAEQSGFPVTSITEITTVIDPVTGSCPMIKS